MAEQAKSFLDKYTSEAKKEEEGENKKTILSNDAYALGESLENLKKEIFRWGSTWR